MKKETLILHIESRAVKESMLNEFREAWEETMACKWGTCIDVGVYVC